MSNKVYMKQLHLKNKRKAGQSVLPNTIDGVEDEGLKFLLGFIEENDVDSVYEVNFVLTDNLATIHKFRTHEGKFENTTIAGCTPHSLAIAYSDTLFDITRKTKDLENADFGYVKPKYPCDLFFCHNLLSQVSRSRAIDIIKKMYSLANKYVVILEPFLDKTLVADALDGLGYVSTEDTNWMVIEKLKYNVSDAVDWLVEHDAMPEINPNVLDKLNNNLEEKDEEESSDSTEHTRE